MTPARSTIRRLARWALAPLAILAMLVAALGPIGAPVAHAATLDLQPDSSTGNDTTIYQVLPTSNGGTATVIGVGQNGSGDIRRGLIRFDLSSIPAGSTINSATLTLHMVENDYSSTTLIAVYRMEEAWVAGSHNNAACTNDATWQTTDCVHAWAAGFGAYGSGSSETSAIGSSATPSTGTGTVTFSLSTSAIAAMIAGGGFTNNGFMIKSNVESTDWRNFGAAENATAADRPELVIDYTAPTPTPTITPTSTTTSTPTVTPTPTSTNTATPSPTATDTPLNTPTSTVTPTVTLTPLPTDTPQPSGFAGNGVAGGPVVTHNFWYWLLLAATDFLFTYFLPFLPRHVDWGIAQTITHFAGPVLLVFYLGVGSFIHLATLFRIIQLMIFMEGINAVFAIRKLIAKLIKLAIFVGLLS